MQKVLKHKPTKYHMGEFRKHADFCVQYQVTWVVLEIFPDFISPNSVKLGKNIPIHIYTQF